MPINQVGIDFLRTLILSSITWCLCFIYSLALFCMHSVHILYYRNKIQENSPNIFCWTFSFKCQSGIRNLLLVITVSKNPQHFVEHHICLYYFLYFMFNAFNWCVWICFIQRLRSVQKGICDGKTVCKESWVNSATGS